MPDLYPVQNNFTSGEISPNLYGRRELAAYANALQTCQNVIPQPQGGAFGRGAFTWLFDGLTGGYGQNVRLIPFVFNQNILNSYLIEIGFSSVTSKSYINIYSAYGTPAQVGSTITTTDTGADLPWNQAETLPPEIELPFGTSRAFKKRWVDAHLTLKNTSNLTVLPLWIYDTVSLAQSVGVSGTVEDANYKILGWDKNAQLRIQQTTGASMEVLALHGKLAVSIK